VTEQTTHHRPANAARAATAELRSALAAPADADGFVSRRTEVDGRLLHVRQRETGRPATPLVLLHGLAVSHRYLMPTARRLAPRPVYLPDLPGFGLSGKPPAALDVPEHSRVLAAWMDQRGVGPAAVLGHSFGAQVAVELALTRPDLVTSLILSGPCTDPAAATMPAQLWRLVRTLPHEGWWQAPILARDIRDAGPWRILRTLHHAVRDHVEAKLPGLRVPVLFVRGEFDRIAPRDWLTRAARSTSSGQTTEIGGAAHNVATTAGPRMAAAIDAFLAG
jgi:pimeloyl-ACP methyl ester carboxylesterase